MFSSCYQVLGMLEKINTFHPFLPLSSQRGEIFFISCPQYLKQPCQVCSMSTCVINYRTCLSVRLYICLFLIVAVAVSLFCLCYLSWVLFVCFHLFSSCSLFSFSFLFFPYFVELCGLWGLCSQAGTEG